MMPGSNGSATSDSYCNHLRSQLQEWQRAFRSKNGRAPLQQDFEALGQDSSTRGKILHASYVALNRVTGDTFAKSLAARSSASTVLVVGGPRQIVAERSLAENTTRHAQDLKRQGANASSAEDGAHHTTTRLDGAATAAVSGTAQKDQLCEHLAVMDLLRPKTQARGMLGAKSGNSVLAAGDGHIRKKASDEKNMHRGRFDGRSPARASAAGAGFSVSKRARAMEAKAEVERTKAPPVGALASAENDKRFRQKTVASLARRTAAGRSRETTQGMRQDTAVLRKNHGDGVVDSSQKDPPRGRAQEPNVKERERERVNRRGGFSTVRRNGRIIISSSGMGAPATTSGSSVTATALAGRRGSLTQSSSSRTSSWGKGVDPPRPSSGGVRLPLLSASSPRPAAVMSTVHASMSLPAPSPRPGATGRATGTTQSVGTRDAGLGLGVTIADEAALAVAMASILSGGPASSHSLASSTNAEGNISSTITAARIVNTVGGGRGGGGRISSGGRASQPSAGTQGISSSSLSVISAGSTLTRVGEVAASSRIRSKVSSEEACGEDRVRGPGLAAPSGGSSRRTRCEDDDDWQMRASRALGRALEKKDQVVAAASGGGECGGDIGIGGNGSSGDERGRVVSFDVSSNNRHCNSTYEDSENTKRAPREGGAYIPASTAAVAARTRISDSEDERDLDGGRCSGSGRKRATPRASSSERGKASEGVGSNGNRAKCSSVGGMGSQGNGKAAAVVTPSEERGAASVGDRGRGGVGPVIAGRKKKPVKATEVSDNFVRMDLKSKGSSRFKRKNSLRDKAKGGVGGRGRYRGGGGRSGSGRWAGKGGGFGGGGFGSKWGAKNDWHKRKGVEDPVTGEEGGPRDRPLSSGSAKNRAGIDVLDQCLDALAVAAGGSGESNPSSRLPRPRNAQEEEELFLRLAPRCAQHQRAGKLLTVRKTGLNKGRKFYACSLPRGEGCDFFMWAEDNPALVLSELISEETGEEWRDRKAALWSNTFRKLPIPELKKELKERALGCGGKKDDLVRRLVNHATTQLETAATAPVPSCTGSVILPAATSDSCATAVSPGRSNATKTDGSGAIDSRSRRDSGSSSDSDSDGDDDGDSSNDCDDDDGEDFEFAFNPEEAAKLSAVTAIAAATADCGASLDCVAIASRAGAPPSTEAVDRSVPSLLRRDSAVAEVGHKNAAPKDDGAAAVFPTTSVGSNDISSSNSSSSSSSSGKGQQIQESNQGGRGVSGDDHHDEDDANVEDANNGSSVHADRCQISAITALVAAGEIAGEECGEDSGTEPTVVSKKLRRLSRTSCARGAPVARRSSRKAADYVGGNHSDADEEEQDEPRRSQRLALTSCGQDNDDLKEQEKEEGDEDEEKLDRTDGYEGEEGENDDDEPAWASLVESDSGSDDSESGSEYYGDGHDDHGDDDEENKDREVETWREDEGSNCAVNSNCKKRIRATASPSTATAIGNRKRARTSDEPGAGRSGAAAPKLRTGKRSAECLDDSDGGGRKTETACDQRRTRGGRDRNMDDDGNDGNGDDRGGGGEGDDDEEGPLTPASALQRVFRHKSFRDGQEWGIGRALAGLPSLLVLATGTGKSLTYQLPALLLPGITVVVSPLVSLMEDQMANLPPQLPAASLSGSHGGLREVARTVRDLRAGRIKVLFLSPEKLCSPAFRRLVSTPGALPPVSLLCVDEAHCVSQWSHNFRPSYLRLGQTIELLRPNGVLALTATASKAVTKDICKVLRIPAEGVRVGSWDRPNLEVQVLRMVSDDDKRGTLSRLLQEPPLDKGSVVVYVWRQATAEALASLLQGDGHSAVAYHGGMEAGARQNAQNSFTRGRARIVVATVAFGLGVDMREIRGVIHFDMPKSIENYVQEIGRAGRDGRTAHCCLLLCDRDFVIHHSLSHSKGLELVQVRGLMRAIVGPPQPEPSPSFSSSSSSLSTSNQSNIAAPAAVDVQSLGCDKTAGEAAVGSISGEGVRSIAGDSSELVQKALSVVDLESKLDVGGEVVETVLSVLEGEPYRLLKLHAVMDDRLHVHFRKRRPTVLAQGEPVIGLLLALGTVEGLPAGPSGYSYGHGSAKVSLVLLSEALGWAPTTVVRELRRLQLGGEVDYSLSQRSYHITLLKRWSAQVLEDISVGLYRTLARAEASEAQKVVSIYRALAVEAVGRKKPNSNVSSHAALGWKSSGGSQSVADSDNEDGGEPAGLLHTTISRYFEQGPAAPATATEAAELTKAAVNVVSSSSENMSPENYDACAIDGQVIPHGNVPLLPESEKANPNANSKAEVGRSPGAITPPSQPPQPSRNLRLPHQPLEDRVCELLIRDASVLISDPSFRGRLDAGFDDGYGGGRDRAGGGLGFFDMSTGRTGVVGGGAGAGPRGMASHSWLLKDPAMLSRAVARVFHGIGSVCFPAAKWRDSTFWARYREYSFGEVKSKLEQAFYARSR